MRLTYLSAPDQIVFSVHLLKSWWSLSPVIPTMLMHILALKWVTCKTTTTYSPGVDYIYPYVGVSSSDIKQNLSHRTTFGFGQIPVWADKRWVHLLWTQLRCMDHVIRTDNNRLSNLLLYGKLIGILLIWRYGSKAIGNSVSCWLKHENAEGLSLNLLTQLR